MKSKILMFGVGILLGSLSLFATVNAQITKVESVYPYSVDYFGQPSQTATTSNVVIISSVSGPTTCVNYLNTFNQYKSQGEEVVKLQNFLNDYNGANLNGQGFYGPVTVQEVKNFQYTYGLPVTGKQYQLTTSLINNIKCGVIAKRDRVVFVQKLSSTVNTSFNYQYATKTTQMILREKVQNTESKVAKIIAQNIIDASKNKENVLLNISKNKLTISTDTPATNTFASVLNSELKNLKENYRSYLVVFFLVLALFWFLRKTATE